MSSPSKKELSLLFHKQVLTLFPSAEKKSHFNYTISWKMNKDTITKELDEMIGSNYVPLHPALKLKQNTYFSSNNFKINPISVSVLELLETWFPFMTQKQKDNLLYYSILSNNYIVFEKAIDFRANWNKQYKRKNKCTPLILALDEKNTKMAMRLLKMHNIRVNLKDIFGRTALFVAASFNPMTNEHFRMIETIVELGANINIADNYGKTPLMMAIGWIDVVRLLLDPNKHFSLMYKPETTYVGATVNSVDYTNKNALIYLIDGFKETTMTYGDTMFEIQSNADILPSDDITTLQLLIKNKIDVNIAFKTINGLKTPLDFCIEKRLYDVFVELINAGAHVNKRNVQLIKNSSNETFKNKALLYLIDKKIINVKDLPQKHPLAIKTSIA